MNDAIEFKKNMGPTKVVTIFGAGRIDPDCKEYKDTIKIGEILASKPQYVVQHGGYGGVMAAVSKSMRDCGGDSIGIGCKELGENRINDYCSYSIEENIFDRLKMLIQTTSIFIIQVGGIGTLAELCLTLDYYRKFDKSDRPQVYLIGNYWKSIMDSDFIPKSCKDMIKYIVDITELELLL